MADAARGPWLTAADVRGAAWSLLTTAAGLGLAIAVVAGVHVDGAWAVLAAAAVVGIGDAVLRPPLRALARRLGVVGALVAGLAAQVAVAWVALTYVPGIHVDGWGSVVVVLLVAAVFMAVGRWAVGAADSEYVVDDLIRRGRRRARRAGRAASTERGLLVVQLDGLARPTLDHALQAGLAPNIARWVTSGSHVAESWWARVPCTTPASQAGLLHGTSAHVPAFRWWDRGLRRLVVTNHPDDAALVEGRMSDGAGLLAGGGVAVSTMFSGDAAENLLVMSRAREGVGPGQVFVHFFSSPFVLVRAVLGTVGEFVKELYQGWQQASRGVRPRVSRLGWYPVLRAVTNVVLRDLNTSLVADRLVAGVPVIFVDLVDYDEIAHHAGPLRPEALRSLEGLDRVVGLWERVAAVGGRRYDLVLLSDHGQSLGATFEQVAGRSFGAFVRELMELPEPAAGAESPDDSADEGETWGSVNTALNALGRSPGARVMVGPEREERAAAETRRGAATGRAPGAAGPVPAGRARTEAVDAAAPEGASDAGAAEGASDAGAAEGAGGRELPEVVVVGSGNLGMVWFPRLADPPDEADVRRRWPRLLPGLLACEAVGVVVVRRGREPVVLGAAGARNLATGEVVGTDPLAAYPVRAAADLLRVAGLEHAGDLVLISRVDDVGMVHAFEGLVGSHGGLGGAQSEAVLIRPAAWSVPEDELEDVGGERMLVGSEAVHRRLVSWLVEAGVRAVPGEPDASGAGAAQAPGAARRTTGPDTPAPGPGTGSAR